MYQQNSHPTLQHPKAPRNIERKLSKPGLTSNICRPLERKQVSKTLSFSSFGKKEKDAGSSAATIFLTEQLKQT